MANLQFKRQQNVLSEMGTDAQKQRVVHIPCNPHSLFQIQRTDHLPSPLPILPPLIPPTINLPPTVNLHTPSNTISRNRVRQEIYRTHRVGLGVGFDRLASRGGGDEIGDFACEVAEDGEKEACR